MAHSSHNAASGDHLSPEAIVAYVDDEMAPRVRHRVQVHLLHCEPCRQEIACQREASERIRASASADDSAVCIPAALLDKLANIPTTIAEAPSQRAEPTAAHLRRLVGRAAFSAYRELEQAAGKLTDAIGERADAVNQAVTRVVQDYMDDTAHLNTPSASRRTAARDGQSSKKGS